MKSGRKRKLGKIRRQTGLTPKQWKVLRKRVVELQGRRCAICGEPGRDGSSMRVKAGTPLWDGSVAESDTTVRRLYLDHDHARGRVRGALCFRCNHRLLGRGLEDWRLHRDAAQYLRSARDYRSEV